MKHAPDEVSLRQPVVPRAASSAAVAPGFVDAAARSQILQQHAHQQTPTLQTPPPPLLAQAPSCTPLQRTTNFPSKI
jgi:hypothetical protein